MSNPLAVTPGDPAGIGPDLCLQLACEPTQADVSWFAIADPEALSQRARTLNLPVEIREYRNQSPDSGPNSGNGRLQVLPYNISTPLIFHLIESAALIRDMHFMLQKEVVDRIVAAPNSGDYGRLSVMTRYYCRPEKCLTVGPGAFRPAPKVHSAVVRLTPHATPPVEVHDLRTFKQTVTEAFNQRRKTLGKIFKNRLNAADFADLGIAPNARPETLDLARFAALGNRLGEISRR